MKNVLAGQTVTLVNLHIKRAVLGEGVVLTVSPTRVKLTVSFEDKMLKFSLSPHTGYYYQEGSNKSIVLK